MQASVVFTTSALLLLASFTIIWQQQIPTADASTTMGIAAVPYFSPTSDSWNKIYEQADTYYGTIKYAIINPCSGPCAEPLSQDWQDVILNLKSRGILTLGYIYYTKESIANIDYYMKDPVVTTNGIFFDKEGSADNLTVFQQYADYVHSFGGTVFINPGYNYAPVANYLNSGAADVANIYEAGLPRLFQMSVPADVPPEKLSAIIKNVNKESDMKKAISQVAGKGVGNVYVTSKSYIALPPYFADEVRIASITAIQ
jgi:hypothetical protein